MRKLTLGELFTEEIAKLFRFDAYAVFKNHDCQRAFLPLGMRRCDHRGFTNRRMAHQRVLEVGGADPFSTGLDHVFATVHDLDAALLVDVGHVAGAEPAVVGPAVARLRRLVIAGGNPWSADFEFAGGLAIVRRQSLRSADAEIDEWQRPALLAANFALLVFAPVQHLPSHAADGSERRSFGPP